GGRPRRGLGPTSEAGPEARGHRFHCGPEIPNILAPGRGRRADRPAVNPGREDANEKPAVESRVACQPRPVTDPRIELHRGSSVPRFPGPRSPLSDMAVFTPVVSLTDRSAEAIALAR